MSISQFIADTINANHLALGLHGFAAEVNQAEPVAPAVHVSRIQTGADNKSHGAARVVIAYPAGQTLPLEHFRAELERIIGKPLMGSTGRNEGQGSPFVISHVARESIGRVELILSLGGIA